MNSAYLVGSDEKHFIVDRAYGEDELENSMHAWYAWQAWKSWKSLKAGFGADLEIVHTTPKSLDDRPSKPVK